MLLLFFFLTCVSGKAIPERLKKGQKSLLRILFLPRHRYKEGKNIDEFEIRCVNVITGKGKE